MALAVRRVVSKKITEKPQFCRLLIALIAMGSERSKEEKSQMPIK